MLINPLDNKTNEESIGIYANGDVISNIISFLISNYSDYLSDIEINRKNVENIIREKVYKEYSSMNTESTIKNIMDKIFGYYILQKYIDDISVTDIRVTKFDNIVIKRNGVWEKTTDSFINEEDFLNFVRYCILKNKGKITNETPIVTISDRVNNLRIEAGIEPINISSPSLVIRIHRPNNSETLESLFACENQMMNIEIYKFLTRAIGAGCNIVISGKGGSGKTTLMRNMVNRLPENLSITSNEETAELYSTHPNIIQREIINNRGEKNISLSVLTAHSLVMSNDVIVIGELKGEEAMGFFDAISTGHIGYATVHAENSKLTLERLVTLMKRDIKSQMYSDKYLRKLLASSVDIIIFMKNFKICEIAEPIFDEELDDVKYNTLFKFEIENYEDGVLNGKFKTCNEMLGKAKEKIRISELEILKEYA